MRLLLVRWICLVVSLIVASMLTNMVLPGQFVLKVGTVPDFLQLMVGVAVLSLVNATLGNLLKLLTLPLNCLTLGLASLLINALMFLLVGNLRFGFETKGFLAALVGSLLYSAMNGVLGAFLPDKKDDKE
ncbi:MAG: phage holin family protein [Armatimonadetes bacterium]|nr:phage holin family protein [Armatimonadota bacterium]